MEVWLLMVPGRYCSTFFSYGEIKIWMEWNLKAQFEVYDIPWQIIFSLACQQLWLARNNKIFYDEVVTARTIIAKVIACAHGVGSVYLMGCVTPRNFKRDRHEV